MHHSTTRATTFPLLPRFFLLLNFSVSHTGWLSKLQIFPNAYTHTLTYIYVIWDANPFLRCWFYWKHIREDRNIDSQGSVKQQYGSGLDVMLMESL